MKYTDHFLNSCGFKHIPENIPWIVSKIQVIHHICEASSPYILYVLNANALTSDLENVTAHTHLLLFTEIKDEHLLVQLSQNKHVHFIFPFENTILGSSSKELNDISIEQQKFIDNLILSFECDQLLQAFTSMLSEGLFSGATIQELTDMAFSYIGNPVFVFNAAFKLIAANKNSSAMDAHSMQIINEGGFTQYDFDFVNHYLYRQRPLHEQVKRSDEPVLVTDQRLGRQRLILCFDTNKDIGHLVISDFFKPFEPIDFDYLIILRNFIYERLQQSEFIKNSMGFPYEFFLSDLLDKKVTSPKVLQSRFSYVNQEFSDDLYCLVIETARSFHTINVHRIRNEMENLIPTLKTLLYQGQIVAVISHKSDKRLTDKDYDTLNSFCIKNGLFCGISNTFENIFNLPDYYKQALRAIELGICHSNEPGLFVYQKYYMEHISHIFRTKESTQVFCDPNLKLLMEYDNKNETDFAYTLYIYLLNERNITLTASQLYVHRNTLVYRMRKIGSIVAYDALTAKERLYYIMSYEFTRNR